MANRKTLSTKSGTSKDKRVVGAYVLTQLSEFIYMYSMAYEIPVSDILVDLLTKWREGRTESMKELVNLVAKRAIEEAADFTPKQQQEFWMGLKGQLLSKQIQPRVVEDVLKQLSASYNAKKRR